jgi:hypothetical protein
MERKIMFKEVVKCVLLDVSVANGTQQLFFTDLMFILQHFFSN